MTQAVEIATSPIPENESAGDPFSSDVFGTNGENSTSDPLPAGADKPAVQKELAHSASWTDRLPKISRKLLESSLGNEKLPAELPEILSKAIEQAMGDVVFAGSGPVRCKLGSIAECDLLAEAAAAGKAGNLSIQIVLEPNQSNACVLVGGGFVHSIIDRIFGSSGYEISNRISPIEMAIAEFLVVKVVANLNDSLGNELFSVGEVSLGPAELFSENEAGAKAGIELQRESSSQLFKVLISREFLSGLKQAEAVFDSDPDARKAAKVFQAIASVPLRAQIGSTRLEAAAVSFLEPGDVVIIEDSQLEWNGGSPKGEIRLLAGAGSNFVVTGEIVTGTSGELGMRMLVKDILSKEAVSDSYTARSIMEDKKPVEAERVEGSGAKENDASEAGGVEQESNEMSASLENLQLRLRVELGGNKMSLREINSLRVGQVIDLGRGPTDSVNLVTDGSDESVAVGELVDIEGRLGVRLTKVFL